MSMLTIDFAPMFPWAALAALGAAALIVVGYGAVRRARGMAWRALAIAALWLAIANPVMVEEERTPISDVAAVVIDESASQRIAGRPKRVDQAVAHLLKRLSAIDGLDVRVIRAGGPSTERGAPPDGTRLFETIAKALSDVPRSRMAATILVTDGQVHDVPAEGRPLPFAGPMHVLLTGRQGEKDRMLVIENVPSFALVGKETAIRIRVVDPGEGDGAGGGMVNVTLSRGGETGRIFRLPVGVAHTIPLKIDRAGSNIFEIEIEAAEGELTVANNRGVVHISGVRERLRVLLVSGEPHPGERMWRNLLKADPSVDLVHFTILRPPEKQDATPVRELSLIAFPIRELFEVKLQDFDLIIFDRYRRRGVLPAIYLDNIVRYIEGGGAVLEAAGPAFATTLSLFRTPLGTILPGAPTGRVFERGLKPRLSQIGSRHPVTADLAGADRKFPRWGRWFRQIEVETRRGMALMEGVDDRPLLIVDRVGKGRVAQLLSDQIWLWARGFENGGPHSELLRRLAHWLMKEPDLEENDLRAYADGAKLTVVRRSVEPDPTPVTVTTPSGETLTLSLKDGPGGRSRASIPAPEMGIYRVSDAKRSVLAAVGNLNPKEYADMRATEELLRPIAAATGGGISWIEDGLPALRRVRVGRTASGRGWFGIVANRDYRVASVRELPLLPGLLVLLIGLGALMAAWRREGH